MKRYVVILCIALLGLFGLLNAAGNKGIRQHRQNLLISFQSPQSQLPADYMKILAGEFKGLVADYLLLEVGSFLGSNQKGSTQDWQNIHLALQQAMALDPYFQQSYLYAQGNLPWAARMPQETIDLLEISKAHRPWDFFPGQYIAFNYYYFFNDYAKASQVFLEAAKIEGAPVILAMLGSRFAIKSQRQDTAMALLEGMLKNENLGHYERNEIEKRVAAIKAVILLEKAVVAYKHKYGVLPASLDQLFETRLIPQIPANPYDDQYFYNKETGQVFFDKVDQKTK